MSLNPVLAKDGVAKNELFPLPFQGEQFILKRAGVGFQGTAAGKKYEGKGKLFLTTMRVVFMRDGDPAKHKVFSSMELPLHLIRGEKEEFPEFKQPIFGANYFIGKVDPSPGAELPLPSETAWRLTFNHGGCMTFLRAFLTLLKQSRGRWADNSAEVPLAVQVQAGANAAFYDPSDPSELYVTQPQPNAVPMPAFYGPPQQGDSSNYQQQQDQQRQDQQQQHYPQGGPPPPPPPQHYPQGGPPPPYDGPPPQYYPIGGPPQYYPQGQPYPQGGPPPYPQNGPPPQYYPQGGPPPQYYPQGGPQQYPQGGPPPQYYQAAGVPPPQNFTPFGYPTQ